MDIDKCLEEFLNSQKKEVDILLADISISKDNKNSIMRKIIDKKNLVEELKVKLQYIESKEYLPHCSA